MRATRSGLVTKPRLVAGNGSKIRRPVYGVTGARPGAVCRLTPRGRAGRGATAELSATRELSAGRGRVADSGEAVNHEAGEVGEGVLDAALRQRRQLGDGVARPPARQLTGLLDHLVAPQLLHGRAQCGVGAEVATQPLQDGRAGGVDEIGRAHV